MLLATETIDICGERGLVVGGVRCGGWKGDGAQTKKSHFGKRPSCGGR